MLSLPGFATTKLQPLLLPQSRSFFCKKPKKPAWMPRAITEHREPQTCALFPYAHADPKPCFDLSTVLVEQGNSCHEKIIRSFLYTHYWPREPSTVGMYMPICSPYLSVLTEKYATSGDRWLAFERLPRTKERKPIGVLHADKTFPWAADEFEEWGNSCSLKPERHNMYFRAHCIRSPEIFDKYNVPYAYEIQVLATSADVTGQGVALLLLRRALLQAMDQRHPLVMLLSKSAYTHSVCERAGMQLAWDMKYSEFVDQLGNCLFYPRRPHQSVCLYIKKFDPHLDPVPVKWKNPQLYSVYKRLCLDKKTIPPHKKRCEPEFPLFPKCQT